MQVPISHDEMKDTQYQYTLLNPHTNRECHIYAKVVSKGVRDYIRRMNLSFAHYKRLKENLEKGVVKKISVRQAHLKSSNHKINTTSVRKIALSPTDIKRYLVNAVDTLPFGHHKTY